MPRMESGERTMSSHMGICRSSLALSLRYTSFAALCPRFPPRLEYAMLLERWIYALETPIGPKAYGMDLSYMQSAAPNQVLTSPESWFAACSAVFLLIQSRHSALKSLTRSTKARFGIESTLWDRCSHADLSPLNVSSPCLGPGLTPDSMRPTKPFPKGWCILSS